jgi:hypothetical protein
MVHKSVNIDATALRCELGSSCGTGTTQRPGGPDTLPARIMSLVRMDVYTRDACIAARLSHADLPACSQGVTGYRVEIAGGKCHACLDELRRILRVSQVVLRVHLVVLLLRLLPAHRGRGPGVIRHAMGQRDIGRRHWVRFAKSFKCQK